MNPRPTPTIHAACSLALSLAGSATTVGAQLPTEPDEVRTSNHSGRIGGTVFDAAGEPIRAAEVWCAYWPDLTHRLLTGHTDGEGFFSLRDAPVHDWKPLVVFARADDGGEGASSVLLTSAALQVEIVVRIWDAEPLAGRVVDENGNGVPGAAVRVSHHFAFSAAERVLGDTHTDENGHFSMDRVTLGEISIQAAAPGHHLAELTLHHERPGHAVELLAKAGEDPRLELRVTGLREQDSLGVGSCSTPFAGIGPVLPLLAESRTDARATWSTRIPRDRSVIVLLHADAYRMAPYCQSTTRDDPDSWSMEFRADHVDTLMTSGVLTDQLDRPLANQRLRCSIAGGGFPTHATTRDDGSFTIQAAVATGESAVLQLIDSDFVLVQAREPHHRYGAISASEGWHEFVVNPKDTLQLRVTRAATIRGRIVDPQQQPLRFVPVQLRVGSPSIDHLAATWTDARGRYRFRGVPPSMLARLTITIGGDTVSPGPSSSPTKELPALEGDIYDHSVADFVLSQPHNQTVAGKLTKSDGEPWVGAAVYLVREGDDWSEIALTSRSGEFCFPLAYAGEFQLRIHRPTGPRTTIKGVPFSTPTYGPWRLRRGQNYRWDCKDDGVEAKREDSTPRRSR